MTGVTGMTGMTGIARITLTTRLQGLYPFLNKKKSRIFQGHSRTFKDTFPVFQTESVCFYFFQNINPILIFVQKD